MITLRQMEQLTGVSRRMLQEYDRIGLLKCRSKTPGGYWLYNSEDMTRLMAIQLLRRQGFSRREIAYISGDPDQPLQVMLQHAEAALLQRRNAVDQALLQLQALLAEPAE